MLKPIKSEFLISAAAFNGCPDSKLPEFAFAGRSNVGKSTLINAVTGQSKLAKTSATPGKTKLLNFFTVDEKWMLADLPGYGYAKVSKQERRSWKKLIWQYLENRQQLFSVFLLIDVRHTPQALDLEMIQAMGEKKIPFALVFTKTDKQTQQKTQQNLSTYKKRLLETWSELPPIFLTSSQKKTGLDALIQYINEVLK